MAINSIDELIGTILILTISYYLVIVLLKGFGDIFDFTKYD